MKMISDHRIKVLNALAISGFIVLMASTAGANTPPGKTESDSLKQLLTKPLQPAAKIEAMLALGKELYIQSKLDEALKVDNQALEVISKSGTANDSAKCYRLIGLVYLQKSWYDKSLTYLMEAQTLFRKTGDKIFYAKALMNVGIVHDLMQNIPMSLEYYNRALAIFTQEHNDGGIADCKLNIAILQTRQKEYEKARSNLLEAASLYQKLGRNTEVAMAFFNLGAIYKGEKSFDSAMVYQNKAYEIWKKLEDPYHQCAYNLSMGEIMLRLKKYDMVVPYLKKAEQLAQEIDAADYKSIAYHTLSLFYSETKDYKQAYQYLNKSNILNDSILNAQTTEKVNQIQYRYEIARREAENEHLSKLNLDKELQISERNIALYLLSAAILFTGLIIGFLVYRNRTKRLANQKLEEKNRQIEKQKNELIRLNASKDKFLTILAHDIKNPVGTMMGLSNVLFEQYDTMPDAEKREFVNDTRTLAGNLNNIVNTLLSWAVSQGGLTAIHPKSFNVNELASKAFTNMQALAGQKEISLQNYIREDINAYADDNMILTVLHNLVGNAIKFSQRGSQVRLEALTDGGNLVEIAVADEGTGMTEEQVQLLFRLDQHYMTKGTAGEKGTGLGLILCKDFVEKNGGTIRVESEAGKGSRFIFTLPLSQN